LPPFFFPPLAAFFAIVCVPPFPVVYTQAVNCAAASRPFGTPDPRAGPCFVANARAIVRERPRPTTPKQKRARAPSAAPSGSPCGGPRHASHEQRLIFASTAVVIHHQLLRASLEHPIRGLSE